MQQRNMLKEFFKLEAAGGILLGMTAILAMVMENSPLNIYYEAILNTPVVVQIGQLILSKPLLLWINDGLMAVFFLLVGLEIKREVMEGQLSSREQISLPAIAALGGLVVPALIYTFINISNPDTVALKGWAIPAATDIAFALGVVMLLGKRVPENLKICLVAIAIIDDLAAILIIALFYTDNLSVTSLGIGAFAIIVLAILNRRNVTSITPYMLAGLVLWVCVLKSGVHATLAGVIIAFFIPIKIKNPEGRTPLRKLEHELHPWVAYMVLPIFAFANAGVSLAGLSWDLLMNPITLGVAAGLFVGKQLGVMLFSGIGFVLKLCKLPVGVSFRQFYGMALLTGIGFTMSLFVGTLAFDDQAHQTAVRIGVLCGTLLSAFAGVAVLYNAKSPDTKK